MPEEGVHAGTGLRLAILALMRSALNSHWRKLLLSCLKKKQQLAEQRADRDPHNKYQPGRRVDTGIVGCLAILGCTDCLG